MNLEIVLLLLFGFGIVYFAAKRYHERKKEDFEKRDN